MMESSSLENWDGRHSKSEQKNAQNIAIAGLKTWKDQSNLSVNSSEIFEAMNDVSMVGPASSGEASNLAGIEGSRNLTNTTSILGLQDEHLSQIMGPSFLMNVPALATPITPRKEALNASNNGSNTTRKFLPADSPLLKRFHESNASSSNTELAQRLEAAISGTPLPRAKNNSDAISLHSADAEGEDEDEDDDMYVAETLLSFSPLKQKEHSNVDVHPSSPSEHNSLFTPPPSYPSAEFLFTPPPLAKDVASTSKTRMVMSYVEIPPCPYPKSAYKLLPSRLFQKKSRPPAQPVQVHMSLGEALQASLDHNDAIGVMGKPKGQPKKKKDWQDTHGKPRKTVAGPSKPSIAAESSSISKNVNSKKKRLISGGEQLKDSTKQKKVDIDLTLSDDEPPVSNKAKKNIRHKPKPLPRRESEGRKHVDHQIIIVGVVKPLAADVRALNTRFVRNKMEKSAIPPPYLKKTQKGFSPWQTPGFLPLSSQSEDDDVSLGDPIPTSWRADFDEVSDDDDVPIISQNIQPEVKQPSPPLSAPPTAPKRVVSRKIDLAALYRNKAKTGSTKSAKSPTTLKHSITNPSVLGPSTSLLSQRSTSPKYPSSHFDPEDEEPEPVIPITPSAKALGKRKAISPPPFSVPSQTPSHDGFLPGQVINQELGQFMNNDSVSSPGHQPYANGVMSAGYSSSIQTSFFPAYQSESSFGLAPESYPAKTEVDQFGFQTQQAPFWLNLEGGITEYQYTTVDPTLLGGTPVFEEPSEPDDTGNFEDSNSSFANPSEDDSDSESFPVAGPSVIRTRLSPSRSSRSSASSSQEYAPPKERSSSVSSSSNSAIRSEVVDNPAIAPILREPSPITASRSPFVDEQEQERSGSEYMPSSPSSKHYIRKPRQASSPSSYDPGIFSEEYAPSATSNYEPSSVGVRKRKQPEPPSEALRALPKRQRVKPQRADMVNLDVYLKSTESETSNVVKVKPKAKSRSAKPRKDVWPTCDKFLYCHQCRNKNNIFKLVCSRCNSIYCCRCFMTRYPDEKFAKKVNDCPRCKSYCNCSHCCNRRGEKYVSSRQTMRTPPPMEMPSTAARPKSTAVPRTTTTTTPSRPVMPGDMEYFGTLYDLNGKRIAATYAPSGGEGSTPSVLFTKETGNQLPNAQLNTRIYVGKVQRSWGLGRDVIIKEIKPMARPKKAPKDGTIRRFVGRSDFVKFPRPRPGEEDEDDMSDNLSSLTSLTDSEEEPGDREDVETFNPHSLGDNDVSLAIILALSASGLMITPSNPA